MIMEISKNPDDSLEKAMSKKRPEIGAELERLLIQWLSITSLYQPEQANALRFPFLKWALEGRAKDVVAYLKKSKTPEARTVISEIERIGSLPFPPKNEKARTQAMEIWAWLKQELHGRVE